MGAKATAEPRHTDKPNHGHNREDREDRDKEDGISHADIISD